MFKIGMEEKKIMKSLMNSTKNQERMFKYLQKGDLVEIISGLDAGKLGRVIDKNVLQKKARVIILI